MRHIWIQYCPLNSLFSHFCSKEVNSSASKIFYGANFRHFSNVASLQSCEQKCQLISENHDAIHKIFKFDQRIRKLLLALTRFDLGKCYQHSEKVTHCRNTQIKYLTQDDLMHLRKQAQDYFEERVVFKQVPLNRTSPAEDKKLADESRLEGIDIFDLSFIDISTTSKFGGSSKAPSATPEYSHKVWERRGDGQLWLNGSANHCNRGRVIKSVYKKVYREPSGVVRMFEEQKFQQMLIAGHFQFLIKFAYQNFLLDDPRLKAILSTIFNYVCQNKLYDALLSTPEYPLFLLHVLSCNKIFSGYLIHLVNHRRASDILLVIKLKNILTTLIQSASSGSDVETISVPDDSSNAHTSTNAKLTIDAIAAVNKIVDEIMNDNLNDALEKWLNEINCNRPSEQVSIAN